MTTQEVATRLVEICRTGDLKKAQDELYAQDIVSTEPTDMMGPREVKGMDAIEKKREMFESMVEEMHGHKISEPVVAGDYFSISWDMDAKMKGRERMVMSEVCVYKVKDGKIVAEQFFF